MVSDDRGGREATVVALFWPAVDGAERVEKKKRSRKGNRERGRRRGHDRRRSQGGGRSLKMTRASTSAGSHHRGSILHASYNDAWPGAVDH
jgi:hypothetical protein